MVVWILHKNLVRGDARSLRQGSAEFRGSTLGFVVAWCKLAVRAQLRTSLVGNFLDGDCWKCGLLFGDTQEHLWNRILRRSDDDDDDGAGCVTTSTRTTDSSSPSCFTNPDVRSSTGNRQRRCSSSSEKHSESHRREWPRSSEGILSLAKRRTSNIVRSRRRHSSLE